MKVGSVKIITVINIISSQPRSGFGKDHYSNKHHFDLANADAASKPLTFNWLHADSANKQLMNTCSVNSFMLDLRYEDISHSLLSILIIDTNIIDYNWQSENKQIA